MPHMMARKLKVLSCALKHSFDYLAVKSELNLISFYGCEILVCFLQHRDTIQADQGD